MSSVLPTWRYVLGSEITVASRVDQHLQINHPEHARAHLEGSNLESGER